MLTPDEDYEALRLFNEQYLGRKSAEEKLHEELDEIERDHAKLFEELENFPKRIFSGKRTDNDIRGLFCAYRFPSLKPEVQGELRWYFREANSGEIWDSSRLEETANVIRPMPETSRYTSASADDLNAWRKEIEQKHVNRHLRDLNVQMGMKATLVCWMEVC